MEGSGLDRVEKAVGLVDLRRGPDSEAVRLPDVPPHRGETGRPANNDFEYTQSRVITVPDRLFSAGRLITGHGRDGVTRAYKLLRTQALQRLTRERWSTIAVVSPASGEGKTLTAINLAISCANSPSHTALLVDLDWLQPTIHTYFEYVPEHNVHSFLRGEQPLSAALVNPGLPRFCFLPCREPVLDSSEQIGELSGFVRELKGRYRSRIVFFDLPPLLASDDALSFLPHVDCALLVVEEGRTRREDVLRSLEMVGRDRLLGIVMNKSDQVLCEY